MIANVGDMRIATRVLTSRAFFLALLLGSAGAADAATSGQTLAVTLLTCPDATHFKTTPTATLLDLEGAAEKGIPLTAEGTGIYTARLSVRAGRYSLGATDGFCEGNVRITVLPEHDRNVGLVLRQGGRNVYEFQGYIAGTLPVVGMTRAFLARGDGAEIPVALDDGAFYAEGLPEDSYTLNLVFESQNLVARVPVSVQRSGLIMNLGMEQLRRSLGRIVRLGGGPEQFQLIWPRKIY